MDEKFNMTEQDDIADARKKIMEVDYLGEQNPIVLRETLLDKARKLIYGQRQKDYGPAKENCETIAKLWSAFLGVEITWKQVPAMMALMKIARLKTSIDHEDTWIDIAGYVGVYDKGMNNE